MGGKQRTNLIFLSFHTNRNNYIVSTIPCVLTSDLPNIIIICETCTWVYSKKSNNTAIGRNKASPAIVCRNHMSKVLFAWTEIITSTNHLVAKALAASLATLEVGFPSVLFEGDSLVIIHTKESLQLNFRPLKM